MKYIRFLAIVALVFLNTTCQKEKISSRPFPRVETNSVSNISSSGATFNAEIIYKSLSEILEYGFIWNEEKDPFYDNSDKISKSSNTSTGKYSFQILTTLKDNVTYYVKSFVRTDNIIVYGKEVSFVSLGSGSPGILSFSPTSACILDTIRISGSNFSYIPASNLVKFDTIKARVIYSSDTLILALVPEFLNKEKNNITVSILGNETKSDQSFTLKMVHISDYYPKSGTFGDTVTITGSNISSNLTYTQVLFINSPAEIIGVNENMIKCKVPSGITSPESIPFVRFGQLNISLTSNFKLTPPIISSMTPEVANNFGETIKISGDFFDPVKDFNKVVFNGVNFTVNNSTRNELTVTIPKEIIISGENSQYDTFRISVTISKQTAQSNKVFTFDYHSRWTKLADFPGLPRIWPVAFSYGSKGYYGFGSYDFLYGYNFNKHYNDLWEYNPETNIWRKVTELPSIARGLVAYFVLNDKLYICCGTSGSRTNLLQEVWEYDLNDNIWTRKNDFPGGKRCRPFSFELNGKGYLGAGKPETNDTFNDFWQYDQIEDSWKQIGNIPMYIQGYADESLIGFSNTNNAFMGFTIYTETPTNFWKFNDSSISWGQAANRPGTFRNMTGFVIDENIYTGVGQLTSGTNQGSKDFYKYDVIKNTWTNIGFGGPQRFAAGGFSIGNKGFICGGFHNSSVANLVDLWMYDPTK